MSSTKTELKEVNLADITVSRTNPRKHFDEESIKELAASIKEKGVLQPIVVRLNGKAGKYELVAGERRFRASKIAEAKTIPAVIRELSDDEALELQIIENLQRKDIHPMEEAVAFKGLMVMKKMEVKEIAQRVGKSPQYVAQRLKLNDLIEEFQKAFYKERMTIATALTIARLRPEDQKEFWDEDDNGMSKITINDWQLRKFTCDLNDAPFDTKDPSLDKKKGACGGCQFNSASNSLLFPDGAKATCSNAPCFKAKAANYYQRELKEAKNNPEAVLISTEYNMGKDGRDLVAKGEKVYGYGSFEKIEKPDAPDFTDAYAYDPDDFDSEKELQDQKDQDLQEYEKDLQEYEKKVNSGKYIKAFVVDGNDKGKYLYIQLRKGKDAPKTTSAGMKVKESQGSVSEEDIKAEIQRVKEGEKRKKELDEEKIHFASFEVFKKNKKFTENKDALGVEELRAAIIYLADKDHTACKAAEKHLKVSNDYTGRHTGLYKKLLTLKIGDMHTVLNIMFRAGLSYTLAPVTSAPNQRPDINGRAGALTDVMKLYEPVAIAEVEMNQLNERGKREERVEQRLKKLNEQLKELKGGTKSKAKGK